MSILLEAMESSMAGAAADEAEQEILDAW